MFLKAKCYLTVRFHCNISLYLLQRLFLVFPECFLLREKGANIIAPHYSSSFRPRISASSLGTSLEFRKSNNYRVFQFLDSYASWRFEFLDGSKNQHYDYFIKLKKKKNFLNKNFLIGFYFLFYFI